MLLSIKQLREALSYDPETGVIFWKYRPLEHFDSVAGMNRSNGRFAGKAAGSPQNAGYLHVCLWGKNYLVHRVLWALHYGAWPSENIDHINGNRSDNRLVNLREVSKKENHRNMKMPSTNKSGFMGVHWSNQKRSWVAQIRVDAKTIYIGRYHILEEAIAARKKAEVEYGFHPNHGRKEGFGK